MQPVTEYRPQSVNHVNYLNSYVTLSQDDANTFAYSITLKNERK